MRRGRETKYNAAGDEKRCQKKYAILKEKLNLIWRQIFAYTKLFFQGAGFLFLRLRILKRIRRFVFHIPRLRRPALRRRIRQGEGFGGQAYSKFLILLLIFAWVFSGWPPIWQNPRIPPEVQEAKAAVNWTQCRTEGGETTIAASASSANVTLATAITDTSQAFLLVDSSGASGVTGGDDHTVSGYIANTTTLTFQRGAAPTTAVYVTYQLVECFNNEFSVQRGETAIGSGASSNTATISSVDTTKSIVIVSMRSSDTAANEQTSLVTGELQDATTVLVKRQSAPTVTATVRWEVVEFSAGSGASVQTNEVTLSSGSANVTDTLGSSVTTGRAWLYCSWDATSNGLQQTTLGCELTNSTTVTFYRYAASAYINRIRYYVIEFPVNGVAVQRGNVLFNTGTCTDGTRCDKDITITAVSATTKALPFVTNTVSGTGTAYPRNKWIEQLTGTTNLRLSNWRFSASAAYATQYWQVIEFPQPPATTIHIVGKADNTAVGTITFPEGAPSAVISDPYNNIDGSGDPQFLDSSASEPVARLRNTDAGNLLVTLEVSAWTNAVASERYELVGTGTTNITSVTKNLCTAGCGGTSTVQTGYTINASAYAALYLEITLSASAGKSGQSTLTVLGETP